MKATLRFSLCAAALLMGAAACHKDTDKPAEGPMERAGKKVDDTAAKASSDATEAGDTIKKKAKDAGL